MTSKQILDSFSETLMRDERILSAPERALVATLLQHAKAASSQNRELQEAVKAVIASAVGETVAQRAFAVLGGSIVEHILEGSTPQRDLAGARTADIYGGPNPSPSPNEPDPPTAKRPLREEPDPPTVSTPAREVPGPGTTNEPDPPTHGIRKTAVSESRVGVAERPAVLPARCVILDEFLSPSELSNLTRFVLDHEADFKTSAVVSHVEGGEVSGVVNYDHRRSRVLMDLAQHEDVMLDRIKSALPMVLDKLGMREFAITGVEAQVTASNDGDFFHFHRDNGSALVASRHLTFVYFFHREPRQFEGGELRIHDSHLKDGVYVSDNSYQAIVPQQNQIVFFPCELLHEITPVTCASQRFADSRFTLNGWLRH